MKLKATEILYTLISTESTDVFKNKNTYEQLTMIAEAIDEIEELTNCNDCIYLEEKEKNLKFQCLIEQCRTCRRSNKDNFVRRL